MWMQIFWVSFSNTKISLIDDNNHHVAVLLATPVVLVNLFLLLGDRKINVRFYTQLDMTYMLATLVFIGSEVLGSLQFSFEYSLDNANFIITVF